MRIRLKDTRQARLNRLTRLEAAVARLERPYRLPLKEADLFPFLAEGWARPGRMLPSARPLLAAFTAYCSTFPKDREPDLRHPHLARVMAPLRVELATFLREHWEADHGRWRESSTWLELALAGFPDVRSGMRERGPNPEAWCAGLTDMEVLFEGVECLCSAHRRVLDWLMLLDKRGSGGELWQSVALPGEEEAVLLAELDVDSPEKAAALARAAHEERYPPGDPQMPAPTSAAARLLPGA